MNKWISTEATNLDHYLNRLYNKPTNNIKNDSKSEDNELEKVNEKKEKTMPSQNKYDEIIKGPERNFKMKVELKTFDKKTVTIWELCKKFTPIERGKFETKEDYAKRIEALNSLHPANKLFYIRVASPSFEYDVDKKLLTVNGGYLRIEGLLKDKQPKETFLEVLSDELNESLPSFFGFTKDKIKRDIRKYITGKTEIEQEGFYLSLEDSPEIFSPLLSKPITADFTRLDNGELYLNRYPSNFFINLRIEPKLAEIYSNSLEFILAADKVEISRREKRLNARFKALYLINENKKTQLAEIIYE